MNSIVSAFRQEIVSYYSNLSEREWNDFQTPLKAMTYKKGSTIFPTDQVCKYILFIANGIVAAEDQSTDNFVITRFFQSKGLCTKVESILNNQLYNDRMFAVTEVQGVLIPKDLFLNIYLHDDQIGIYFRKKLLEIIVEDKQFISIKTNSSIKAQLAFLQEYYPEVVLETPWKYIADFMGVTPSWLSRVLKKDT
ncbi:MAG: Crp/Fnr family transcriptional regulator [Saprospiraceae bacterium]|nr:Crp/Fnr family transcriptional regulator [Saprospiraceae bacterium]